MKRTIRTTTILLLMATCVLFVFSAVFTSFGGSVDVAYAVLPASYTQDVADEDLDWYFGEDYLDLSSLKETVNGWFLDTATYDFSSFENNPIVIAVIDTGINFVHEIFEGKYDADGNPVYDGADIGEYDVLLRNEDGDLICRNTVVDKSHISTSVLDDSANGHGTHVAGTIATLIHALNLEKYIKILPIKAGYPKPTKLDPNASSFDVKAVDDAIEFALQKGADVINLSITSTMSKQSETKDSFGALITDERADSAVFVAAAGNSSKTSEGDLTWEKGYPAASSKVIGVMNATYSDKGYTVYSTSNYGNAYDLAAPGFSIYSAKGDATNEYQSLKGTSMAAPFVSFGAALATLKYRAIAKAIPRVSAKTPRQITEIIRASSKESITYKKKDIKFFDWNVFAGSDSVYALMLDFDHSLETQMIGSVQDVEISASVLPFDMASDELLSNVKWYKQEGGVLVEVGSGASYVLNLPSTVGSYEIVAGLEYDGEMIYATKSFNVQYVAPSKEDTKIDVPDEAERVNYEYAIGKTYLFGIENHENFDEKSVVIWYVDGEYAGNGWTFEFTPNEYGEYLIQVKINGVVLSDEIELKVGLSLEQKNRIYLYASIAAIGGAVIITCACVIVYLVKKKRRVA